MTEQAESQQVVTANKPISAIFVREHLERFHARLVEQAHVVAKERQQEFDALQQGLVLAQETGEVQQTQRYRNRITRRARDLERAWKVVEALEAGFVPMPRLPAVSLEYMLGIVPPEALLALDEAKKTGLFQEFRVVDGRNATRGGWPRSWTAPKGRDPILVGMIGDQLFPLAWWT